MKKRPRSNYFSVYDLGDDNIHEWIVYVIGPPHTSYAGGCYRAILRFPPNFPNDPPSLQFTCNLYHPNVYRDGKVCISTLQHPSPGSSAGAEYWRPVLGVEQALLSVVSLLSDANTDDPANPEAAAMLKNDPARFKEKVERHAELSRGQLPDDFMFPVVSSGQTASATTTTTTTDGDGGDGDEEEEEYVYSDEEWELDQGSQGADNADSSDDDATLENGNNAKTSILPRTSSSSSTSGADYGAQVVDLTNTSDSASSAAAVSTVHALGEGKEEKVEASTNVGGGGGAAVSGAVVGSASSSTDNSSSSSTSTNKRCLGDALVGSDVGEELLVAQRGPKFLRRSNSE